GGNATVSNWGSIGGGVTATAGAGGTGSNNNNGADGSATLDNYLGSRIGGAITLIGTSKNLNFFGGGNYLYTLNTLSGVNINTNGTPFATSGNTIAVLDPNSFALVDRSLVSF